MFNMDIVRAWKDEEYRLSLSEAELASLPENPAGIMELADSELDAAAGGTSLPCDVFNKDHTINVVGKAFTHTLTIDAALAATRFR